MKQYQFNINGQSDTGVLSWNQNWSLGSLQITDPFNSADTQTCTYSHDDLARIASASCGSAFSGTYTYDAFGNLNKSGTYSFQPTYSPTTNQMSAIGSFTPTYDSNGDVTNDNLNTYAWDVEERPTTIDGIGVTYDALERMVEQDNSGNYIQLVWSPTGSRLGYMNGQTFEQGNVPLPGGAVVAYNSSGIVGYQHKDWLGSYRLFSLPNRTVYFDGAYGPFGETYALSGGTVDYSFAGHYEDTVSSAYDSVYREYGMQGRWPSPDPSGMAAANPANPQSWNRYAYVLNNPLSSIDPLGFGCANGQRCTPPPPPCEASGCNNGVSCTIDGTPAVCAMAFAQAQSSGLAEGGWLLGIPVWTGDYMYTLADPETTTPIEQLLLMQGIGSAYDSDYYDIPLFDFYDMYVYNPSSPNSHSGGGLGPLPQTATDYCQQHGQLSFNVPFTNMPVTVGFSATLFGNYSTTNDIALTFPPSAGASLDITVGAPQGPNIPVQVGAGKNLSIGTFLTTSGPSGFSLSLGPSVGSPVTFSPQVANACGL